MLDLSFCFCVWSSYDYICYVYVCIYIYIYMYVYSDYDSYNRQAGEWQNTNACSRTHKSEMETLPEALGRSAEQSQPPENLRRMAMENDRGEELGPSPAALRPL